MSEFKADDRVVDETFSECLSLVRILHALLVADTREANTLNDDADTFVIEVGHDDAETFVLFADEVFYRYFDVLERHVRSAR